MQGMSILARWSTCVGLCATVRRAELHYVLCGRLACLKADGLQDVVGCVLVLVGLMGTG